MKTPLEELIESWEKRKPIDATIGLTWFTSFIDDAKKALPKEKEQREELIRDVCVKTAVDFQSMKMSIKEREEIALGYYNEVIKPKQR